MPLSLSLSLSLSSLTGGGGIPLHITVDGVTYTRLMSATGEWLYSSTGQPLYGRSA